MTETAPEDARAVAVKIFTEFEAQLAEKAEAIAMSLPPTMTKAKFTTMLMTAVRANPAFLTQYDRRNLFAEVMKAANDGIPLDGKHGALVPRKGVLAYQPMAAGIRARAWDLDGIILDAKCVRVNDGWEHEEGDKAYIKHTPLPPWKGKRGDLAAVYCIVRQFKKGEPETVLHREVMFRDDVMAVKSFSKQQDKPMWTTLEEEGWEKSVIHRCIKSVPCSSGLKEILARDYEDFDFTNDRKAGPFDGLPPASGALPLPPRSSEPSPAPPAAAAPAKPSAPAPTEPAGEKPLDVAGILKTLDAELAKVTTLKDANAVYAKCEHDVERRMKPADQQAAYDIWNKHELRINPQRKVG